MKSWKIRNLKKHFAFLVDITSHFNNLNLKLKGRNEPIVSFSGQVLN